MKTNNNWRWLDGVKMIWRGTQNDPLLKYKWITANYRTIEDYLYDLFKGDIDSKAYSMLSENARDIMFDNWLKENFYEVEDIFEQVKENDIF